MHVLAQLPAMEPVIDVVAVSEVDRLKPLRGQLLIHDSRVVGYLGAVRSPGDSWLVRRRGYLEWLQEPLARALFARDREGLRGHAAVRVLEAQGRAGTEGAMRFYQREGAVDFERRRSRPSPSISASGPATRRWRPNQAVCSSGPACAGRRRRVARPPGMARRRRRAASVLADGTPPAPRPGQQRHPRQPGQQPGSPGDRQPVAAGRQPREHRHDDRHRSDQQDAQGAWLADRDRHSARKTKMPQIRNQGSQRYACHFWARRSAGAVAWITPAWTSSPLAVRTRP